MIYKYCSKDGFDIIENFRLKVALIETLNDPFDLCFDVDPHCKDHIIKDLFHKQHLINEWENIFKRYHIDLKFASDMSLFVDKILNLQVEAYKNAIPKIRDGIFSRYGIISLSKYPDIVPLWSHYGDKHKGIVVGIDENQLGLKSDTLLPIEYTDDFPQLKITADALQPSNFKPIHQALKTKAKPWEYEQEIRLLADLTEMHPNGNYYADLPPSSIKSLYFGASFSVSKNVFPWLEAHCFSKEIEVYRMEKTPRKYELTSIRLDPSSIHDMHE